jgi:hypothetical protein
MTHRSRLKGIQPNQQDESIITSKNTIEIQGKNRSRSSRPRSLIGAFEVHRGGGTK